MRVRASVFLLAVCLAACGEDSAPVSPVQPSLPSQSPPPAPSPTVSLVCAFPGETGVTLDGVVSEREGNNLKPLAGATMELYLANDQAANASAALVLVRTTVTNAVGRYCVFFPEPTGASGLPPEGGQPFELRARKDGYVPASTSFRFGYSKWDYGGMSLSLELVRQ